MPWKEGKTKSGGPPIHKRYENGCRHIGGHTEESVGEFRKKLRLAKKENGRETRKDQGKRRREPAAPQPPKIRSSVPL